MGAARPPGPLRPAGVVGRGILDAPSASFRGETGRRGRRPLHPASLACRRGDLWSPACPRIHQPVGRDDLGAPSACRDASGARRFFEGGFAGFLSEAPPAPPTRRAHRFCCQKRWENHQGPRFLRWLRVDFHRRRPWRLRPWTQGLMAAVGCVWLAETGRASPPVVDASFRSFASPQAAKLTPSTASPLPTEPTSLGFGGGPVFAYVTGAAAPRVARIGITPQALTAAALYQVRPPGRHRCHAAEIPWRLW